MQIVQDITHWYIKALLEQICNKKCQPIVSLLTSFVQVGVTERQWTLAHCE
jgi:uncharacterized protein YpbB